MDGKVNIKNRPCILPAIGAIAGAWALFLSVFLIDVTKTQGLQLAVVCLFTYCVLFSKRKFLRFSMVEANPKEKAGVLAVATAVSVWITYIVYQQYFMGLFGDGQIPKLIEQLFSVIPGGIIVHKSLVVIGLLFLGSFFLLFFFVLLLLMFVFVKVIALSRYKNSRQQMCDKLKRISQLKICKSIANSKFPWTLFVSMFVITTAATYCAYLEGSDFLYHSIWAQEMTFPYFTDQSYFLWHLGVKAMSFLLPLRLASSLFTGLVNAFTAVIVYKIYTRICNNRFVAQVVSFVVMLVYPIWVYFLNPWINKPAATPNPWHNPTTFMVRPFAILAFYLFIRIYDRYAQNKECRIRAPKKVYTNVELIAFPAVLLLSNLAKPTFIQIFIPGLAVFLLIELFRSKGKAFVFCVKIALAFIPSAILSIFQIMSVYTMESIPSEGKEEGAHIVFAFLDNYGGFGIVPILTYLALILLIVAFPIYVICMDPKGFFSSSDGKLAVILFATGTLQHMFITEEGRELPGDNWAWGKILGAFLLWMVALYHFISHQKKYNGTTNARVKLLIGYGVLALHLISGVVYLYWRLVLPNFWS